MKLLIKGSIVVIVFVISILGYFGFIGPIARVLGTDKPRDLNMAYSEASYKEGLKKAAVAVKDVPPESSESIMYEGSHEVRDYFSDEELTAHAYSKDWVDYPITDVQVKINDDNTIEVSGIVKITRIGPFLSAMGISDAELKEGLAKANIPFKDMPFYAKGAGTASDNKLNIDVSSFEVGRFPVPANIINQYEGQLIEFGHTIMRKIDGFSVKEARIENNAIYFDGTLPDAELTRK